MIVDVDVVDAGVLNELNSEERCCLYAIVNRNPFALSTIC